VPAAAVACEAVPPVTDIIKVSAATVIKKLSDLVESWADLAVIVVVPAESRARVTVSLLVLVVILATAVLLLDQLTPVSTTPVDTKSA